MSEPTKPASPGPFAMQWTRKHVYFVLGDPVRRRIFLELAQGKAMGASDFKTVQRSRDGISKQLGKMRKAGLLLAEIDPSDFRKSLFELPPWLPIKTTPTGRIVDFGFIIVRLKEINS